MLSSSTIPNVRARGNRRDDLFLPGAEAQLKKNKMRNLAGVKDCDDEIRKELETAGIGVHEFGFVFKGEVPTKIVGFLQGWKFERLWYYWAAKTETTPLLFKYAEPLHEKYGKDVRVDGHCGCPAPREWFKDKWHIGVNHYHVDSVWGLKALADAIKRQTNDSICADLEI